MTQQSRPPDFQQRLSLDRPTLTKDAATGGADVEGHLCCAEFSLRLGDARIVARWNVAPYSPQPAGTTHVGASALSQIPFTRTSPRILIVDDEPESIRLLVAFLRDRYPDVMVARDGFDGLQKAAKGLPDVILLDMSMPGLSGLDVCRRLKLERRLASIPVIFLTAHTSVEEKLAAFDAGAVDYVTKPFSDREVLARVAVHAASARAINQAVSQPPPVDTWTSQFPQDRDDELLRTACEHLRQHLSSSPSVAELAAALRTSAFKLDGLFQKRLGLSVFEYSMELRLTVARQMLLETDAQIKRVAWTVGYANPGDLSRAFHKRFGLSPRAFRASRGRDAC